MKTIALLALLFFPAVAAAADPPPVIDYEARVRSVAALKEQIARREARFEALRQDLRALDARVEEQVAYLVKTLSSLKDSQESRTRVANIKEDVMQALVRSISLYRQKRMSVYERLRLNPAIPKEQSELELKLFQERIGTRIGQVMELARSFPGHRDVAKYESDGDAYWNGWQHENSRVSEEWKQNRRDANSSDVLRREVLQKLDKAMDSAKSRRAAIADTLANRKLTDREREIQQEELGRIDAALDAARMQRRELALPGDGATQAIGLDEARDIEEMIDDARADLSRDAGDIMRKLSELDADGLRIYALKENLKAREDWLQKNPPPAK